MEIIGLITEYNPFHLGHLYQINKVKEMFPDSIIITVMSGYFTQRGEVSIIDKWNKTKIALDNNIDIVIELPFTFATQSADIFAKGSVSILNALKVNKIVFGSECDDINLLKDLVNIQLNNKEYDKLVKKYLSDGINYPTAMSKALKDLHNFKIESPNDLLGLSYVKEIIKNNYPIEPITIKRTNNYHGNNAGNILSASEIRNKVKVKEDVTNFVPKNVSNYINKDMFIDNYFNLLKYKILTSKDNLNIYNTVDEGIENRILKYINISDNLFDLIMHIKTKRYTYNKISRMLLHILTNFTKEDAKNTNITYIRLLGFNQNGRTYLNSIKKNITLPIITKYKQNIDKNLDIDYKAALIYTLLLSKEKKDYLIKMEHNTMPIIK